MVTGVGLRGLATSTRRGGIGTLRVAVLGTGSAGLMPLRALRQLEGVEPVAVPRRLECIEALAAMGMRTSRDLREAAATGAIRREGQSHDS